MIVEYVYLLIEREFIHKNEPVYKIGQTTNLKNRMRAYPKNSNLVLSFIVNDCKRIEKSIKRAFKTKFKQRLDIGTEYFEGNPEELKSAFEEIVLVENIKPNDHLSMTPNRQQLIAPVIKINNEKMHRCECGVLCTTNYNLERHRLTRSHEVNLLCGVVKENGLYACTMCQYSTLRKDNFRKHVQSAKHHAKLAHQKPQQQPQSQQIMVQAIETMNNNNTNNNQKFNLNLVVKEDCKHAVNMTD